MKRNVKKLLCVVIVAVVLLGFVAKYDTGGFYWGMEKGRDMGFSHTHIFPNSFGRTVYVYAIGKYGDEFDHMLLKKYGRRVIHVQTMPPNFANHLDFFNGRMSPRLMSSLVEQAGVPDARVPHNLYTLFSYQTADGYTYVVKAYGIHGIVYDVLDPADCKGSRPIPCAGGDLKQCPCLPFGDPQANR